MRPHLRCSDLYQPIHWQTHHATAAEERPEQGMVSTHAQTIRSGHSHRTADSLRVAPTPMMAPVMVCVVETGMPNPVAMKSVIAPPVSAQKPPTG